MMLYVLFTIEIQISLVPKVNVSSEMSGHLTFWEENNTQTAQYFNFQSPAWPTGEGSDKKSKKLLQIQ